MWLRDKGSAREQNEPICAIQMETFTICKRFPPARLYFFCLFHLKAAEKGMKSKSNITFSIMSRSCLIKHVLNGFKL